MFPRDCSHLPQALVLQILASLPSDAQACSAKLVCKASCRAFGHHSLVSASWEELPLWVVQQMSRQHQNCREELLIARAELGDVQAVVWLLQNCCSASEGATEAAAAQGHVKVLAALQAHGCLLDEGTCCAAARAGKLVMQTSEYINTCLTGLCGTADGDCLLHTHLLQLQLLCGSRPQLT
jgi:hypothetical protein